MLTVGEVCETVLTGFTWRGDDWLVGEWGTDMIGCWREVDPIDWCVDDGMVDWGTGDTIWKKYLCVIYKILGTWMHFLIYYYKPYFELDCL